jgi:L-ascorbate metabolism protein UlaG (beta-lactamase superfamily)
MIITWHGQSCFTIAGDKNSLVTDPFDASYGIKVPRLAADLVTVSHQHKDHNNISAVKGINKPEPFVISGPGEYEVGNIFIYGIGSFHDDSEGQDRGANTMYRFEIDGMSISHLGDLGHIPSAEQLEKLEGTDILLIPVGGTYTIDGKQANQIITRIEPRIVIPMHYQIPGLKTSNKIDDLSVFCKEIGICPKEELPKYKISKKDLPQQDLQVVLLQP